MNKAWVVAQKELAGYFRSPLAYIILVITISIFNVFFFMIIDQNREASLRDMFRLMEFLFVFIVPLLTMKAFAEEKTSGTMEFLLTAPVRKVTIVWGKYLGSLLFFTILILLTTSYYFIIEAYAQPDRAAIWTGYFGIWLEGALFLAIGLMASSWTRSQTAAAIGAYAIIFMLYFAFSFAQYTDGITEAVIRYLSTMTHLENFIAGVVNISDFVYYVSGIAVCLFLTRIFIDTNLWE